MLPRDRANSNSDLACRQILNPDEISEIKGMALEWCDIPAVVQPTAHGLVLDVFGDCKTTLADTTYSLRKVRLLLPSVHRWGDRSWPLEVQFVHEADRWKCLLLAVLFREGEPGPEMRAAFASILLRRGPIRLIDLIPLSRCFFIHDVSDQANMTCRREVHMIHVTDMAISSTQLADLHAGRTLQ